MSILKKSPYKTILLSSVLILWLALNLWTLGGYPAAFCDEAFYTRNAYNYFQSIKSGEMWPPEVGRVFYLPYGRLFLFLQGALFTLFGQTLWSARLIGILGWALAVIATYYIGKYYTEDDRVALWAAGIMAFAWVAFLFGRNARPSGLAAGMSAVLVAFTPWVLERSEQKGYLVLLALGMILLPGSHPTAFYPAIPIIIWVIASLVHRRLWASLTTFLVSLAVFGIGLVYFRLGSITPMLLNLAMSDPMAFLDSYVGSSTHAQSGVFVVFWRALRWLAIDFWWSFYGKLPALGSLPQAVLFIIGLIGGVSSRHHKIRMLTLVLIAASLIFALVNASFTISGYAMLWLPFYAVLSVYTVYDLHEHWGKFLHIPEILLGSLLLLYFVGDVVLMRKYTPTDAKVAEQTLSEDMTPGASIMISSNWWFVLSADYVFIDETQLAPTYSTLWWNAVPDAKNLPLEDVQLNVPNEYTNNEEWNAVHDLLWQEFQPDYVLNDGLMGCADKPTTLAETYTAQISEHCTLQETEPYALYTCQWDGE